MTIVSTHFQSSNPLQPDGVLERLVEFEVTCGAERMIDEEGDHLAPSFVLGPLSPTLQHTFGG